MLLAKLKKIRYQNGVADNINKRTKSLT